MKRSAFVERKKKRRGKSQQLNITSKQRNFKGGGRRNAGGGKNTKRQKNLRGSRKDRSEEPVVQSNQKRIH